MSNTSTTGILEYIDPTTLIVETNVRTTVPLEKGFIESIRENGVLMPLLAWRDPEGGVHVRAGQRRTLAAREAGTATVPVYIVDSADDDEARRLIEQMVENEQREELTDADRAEAWKQMEIAGLSVTAIARRTGAKRDRIKAGLAVAHSETGTALVSDAGLTLDQAATLLEFEDAPEVVADLTETAMTNPGYFPTAVQRARNERAAAEKRAAVAQEEAAKGHRILDERPSYDSTTPVSLSDLRDVDGNPVDAEAIQGKEGVSAYVTSRYDGEAHVSYYLDDPSAHGYKLSDYARQGTSGGPMTDEQKAERKTLIANNKEWAAAETVRREWLTTLLTRKTLPKDAPTVIAQSLTHAARTVAGPLGRGSDLAHQLLGLDAPTYGSSPLADYLDAHPTKAVHVALAVALGNIEETTSRDSWRRPSADVARYLRTLAAWGHTLTPVEKIAAQIPDED